MSNESTENDDLFGDATPEVAPEVTPDADFPEKFEAEPEPIDLPALRTRAEELRSVASAARAEADVAEREAQALELVLAENTVEPTLQETNAYMRRLDAEEQAQRIALRSQIAQMGFKTKRTPHPPLFTR